MHATETVGPAIVSPRCLALGYTMFAHVKFESALVGLVCIAVGCMNGRASAVTAEVARKCAALTAKAYPPQVPGNPAAGLAKGTVQSKRDYFNKCVANGGTMDDDAPEHPPLPPSRGAASVPQRDRTNELSQSLCPLIQSVAAQNELPVEFFARLIWQESRLRPDAASVRKGSRSSCLRRPPSVFCSMRSIRPRRCRNRPSFCASCAPNSAISGSRPPPTTPVPSACRTGSVENARCHRRRSLTFAA